MNVNYLLLLIGFILIIKSSDILVDAAKSIAAKFKVPKAIIALTIIAFGTCAPELAISFTSIAGDNGSIALANVIGSCIINILLVIGTASLMHPIKIRNNTLNKELPLLLLITIIFVFVVSNGLLNPLKNGTLDISDGILLFIFFIIFMIYVIRATKKSINFFDKEKPKYGIITSFIYLILSLIIITYSADMIVDNVVAIAQSLHISEKVITMTVIVIGTSLPELFLTIASVRKKEYEMAVGNIIGTNIFNICAVLGLPIIFFNGFTLTDFSLVDIGVVLISATMLYTFAKSERTLTKKEGILMLSLFVVYYLYIFIV